MTSDRDSGGLRVSRRRALAIGGAAALSVVTARGIPRLGTDGAAPDRDRDDDEEPIARVHDAGITGAGVDVAVLDPTGFDPTHEALAGAVADVRQFGSERAVVDRTTHGTAAAAAVAQVAPDADLSLASFREQSAFLDAVAWCLRRETDVILAPVAAHGAVSTPRSRVFRAARRAVEAGVAVVAPAGNAALGHWRGPLASLAAENGAGPTRLRVRPLPTGDGDGGSVAGRFVAWLLAEPEVDVDLTLALLQAVDGGERWNLVAVSRPTPSRVGQRLVADLDDGSYALVVRPSSDADAGGAAAGGRTARIEVTTPTHALSPSRPLGSVAVPASVHGVVGVGVTDDGWLGTDPATGDAPGRDAADRPDASGRESDGDVGAAPYSGRGPTPRGDPGVDVVAPPRPWIADGSPGTSAAAARAAGVVALLRAADPSLSPAEVAATLRASAGDVGRPGTDLATGWGRLDVVAAVQRARSR